MERKRAGQSGVGMLACGLAMALAGGCLGAFSVAGGSVWEDLRQAMPDGQLPDDAAFSLMLFFQAGRSEVRVTYSPQPRAHVFARVPSGSQAYEELRAAMSSIESPDGLLHPGDRGYPEARAAVQSAVRMLGAGAPWAKRISSAVAIGLLCPGLVLALLGAARLCRPRPH